MPLPRSWVTVTPFSKFLALTLFIAMPFLGFYLGLQYQQKYQPQIQNSGIYGIATVGPTCPVQKTGEICIKSFQGNFIVETPNQDHHPFKFSSDNGGNFKIGLPPGNYLIYLDSPNTLPTLKPTQVQVTAGNFTKIDLMLDTGIR